MKKKMILAFAVLMSLASCNTNTEEQRKQAKQEQILMLVICSMNTKCRVGTSKDLE